MVENVLGFKFFHAAIGTISVISIALPEAIWISIVSDGAAGRIQASDPQNGS